MGLSLEGKAAIVTGAGRGIGRATASLLARLGASVVVNDIGTSTSGTGEDSGPAEELAREIVTAGGSAVANTDSVVGFESAGRIVAAAVAHFGRVDILVNNAGISAGGAIWELEPDVFARVTRTHIDGTYNCTRHAVPHMRQAGWGRIVNLVSRSGLIGIPGTAAYGTGKGGVFGLTNVVSRDLAPFGITVNGVNPASTDTRMVGEAIEKGRLAGGEMARRAESLNALLQQPEDAITGQFFFVRGTEIGVFRPLTLADTTSRDTPWSAQELARALGALEIPPLDSPY
jgi:NAD(P)-dependent dehydrogenase (short-subunit alcohol dehydrogenase family)